MARPLQTGQWCYYGRGPEPENNTFPVIAVWRETIPKIMLERAIKMRGRPNDYGMTVVLD